MKYTCVICGYTYDEETEGVGFEHLPDDWSCPVCDASREAFELITEKTLQH